MDSQPHRRYPIQQKLAFTYRMASTGGVRRGSGNGERVGDVKIDDTVSKLVRSQPLIGP